MSWHWPVLAMKNYVFHAEISEKKSTRYDQNRVHVNRNACRTCSLEHTRNEGLERSRKWRHLGWWSHTLANDSTLLGKHASRTSPFSSSNTSRFHNIFNRNDGKSSASIANMIWHSPTGQTSRHPHPRRRMDLHVPHPASKIPRLHLRRHNNNRAWWDVQIQLLQEGWAGTICFPALSKNRFDHFPPKR